MSQIETCNGYDLSNTMAVPSYSKKVWFKDSYLLNIFIIASRNIKNDPPFYCQSSFFLTLYGCNC